MAFTQNHCLLITSFRLAYFLPEYPRTVPRVLQRTMLRNNSDLFDAEEDRVWKAEHILIATVDSKQQTVGIIVQGCELITRDAFPDLETQSTTESFKVSDAYEVHRVLSNRPCSIALPDDTVNTLAALPLPQSHQEGI